MLAVFGDANFVRVCGHYMCLGLGLGLGLLIMYMAKFGIKEGKNKEKKDMGLMGRDI